MSKHGSQLKTPAGVLAIALLLIGAGAMTAMINTRGIHLTKTPIYPKDNRQLASLPTQTPNWIRVGSDQVEATEVLEVLGTENYLNRFYTEKDPKNPARPMALRLHGAYYTGGIDTVPHIPERCFVGGGLQQSSSSRSVMLDMDTSGWAIDRTVPEEFGGMNGKIYTTRLSNDRTMTDAPGLRVRLPRNVGPDDLIQMRVSEFIGAGRTIYAGYFFIANGRTKANANDVRALAFNLDDNYSFYLKVQINSNTAESMDEFVEASSELLSELIGEIMRCVPDWTKVDQGTYPENNKANEGEQSSS